MLEFSDQVVGTTKKKRLEDPINKNAIISSIRTRNKRDFLTYDHTEHTAVDNSCETYFKPLPSGGATCTSTTTTTNNITKCSSSGPKKGAKKQVKPTTNNVTAVTKKQKAVATQRTKLITLSDADFLFEDGSALPSSGGSAVGELLSSNLTATRDLVQHVSSLINSQIAYTKTANATYR